MNLSKTSILVSTLAVFAFAGLPAQATPIDQVKAKVEAIKKDTSSIKSKTSNVQNKVEGIAQSTTALIQESYDIRTLVEPLEMLRQMKEEFVGGGFEPAELLEIIDTSELTDKIDELKRERDEIKAAMNDPNIEVFRAEFVDTLQGMNSMISPNGVPTPTPLQTLVENAPMKLLATLKLVTESGTFEEMNQIVQSATAFYSEYSDELATLKEMGQQGYAAYQEWKCNRDYNSSNTLYFKLIDQEHHLNELVIRMDYLKLKFGDKLDKTQEVAIHGYVGVEINVGKRTNKSIDDYTNKFKNLANDIRQQKEKLNFVLLTTEC